MSHFSQIIEKNIGRIFIGIPKLYFSPTYKRHLSTNIQADKLPFPDVLDVYWHIQAAFFISIVGGWGRTLLGIGNKVKVYNHDRLLHFINNRPVGTPLITVCNHTSMLDDPALIATLANWRVLFNSKKMRWSLAAKEICFSNRFFTYFCSHGKVIPVVRGAGVYQAAVDFTIKRLNAGDWVHVFPEGKVTLEPIRLKWGVGRMISECTKPPIVLPFYHTGMNDFLPTSKPYIPRFGKDITVCIGEPINYTNILKRCQQQDCSQMELRKSLTDLVEQSFAKLKLQTEALHRCEPS
ncbi:tafazzin-like [Hydractinia symbiolongicarpus]|uniref:tafazzin-like n=1 Tax=Hydractinia symbiolongicarpus TaxID=13093 RepID=UPI002549F51A|nr:tafazzin-like [Hydractinia symbiolongicarpus]